jgi:hypothetical protein
MRSVQLPGNSIVAASGYDRPSALLRPSSVKAGTYGCESCHLGLIVAVNDRQNGNKLLCHQEIGQNKKRIRGRFRWGPAWGDGFPRDFPEKWPRWTFEWVRKTLDSSFKRAETVPVPLGPGGNWDPKQSPTTMPAW